MPALIRPNLCISLFLVSLSEKRAFRWLIARDVIRLHPTGRSNGEPRLCPRRNLACGFYVAANERRLRGGKVGMRKIVLLRVCHCQLAEYVGHFRLAGSRGL